MKHLKDIIQESLLDDEDEIMDKAYDVSTNPFLFLARTPKDICDDHSRFIEVLWKVESLIKQNAKLVIEYKRAKSAKYRIAMGYDSMMAPRMYIKCGRKSYMIQGQAFSGKIQPYVMDLTPEQGSSHFENNGPYYIPNAKLMKEMDEFVEAYFAGRKNMDAWNKYIGK